MDSLDRLRRGVMSLSEFAKIAEEVLALRADLKALAVAASYYAEYVEGFVQEVGAPSLKEALARPGVKAVLDQATSRAAATTDD